MTAEFPTPQTDPLGPEIEAEVTEPQAELPGPQPEPTARGHLTRAQLTWVADDARWEIAVVLYGVPADEWPSTELPGPQVPTLTARGKALARLGYAQTGPGSHYWEWAECQDGDHDPVQLMAHTEVQPTGPVDNG
ncbi:DUF6303 family protein [Streptomyces caniferus]|uniref:DUF6303 family protein n=1 Tax=Streptomyces caniferus TaxID=285557 RepID=A0A640S3Z1_9ACTN|nr:DUF6303 family protein [Streptomyces caniferus]GFE05707.1 hypothetical protein Scani_19750 [Streptomyces caniferus]